MSGDGGAGGKSDKPTKRRLVTLTIDGRTVQASDRATILDVARREKIFVPTLCYDPRLAAFGACRVCLVGVEGARGPVAACTTPVREGMVVDTKDEAAQRVARGVVELVLSDYPEGALAAESAGEDDRNELRQVAKHFGLETSRYAGERHAYTRDDRHPYIKMDLGECIVCGRCVRACDEIQGTFALAYAGRGWNTKIVAGLESGFTDSACVSCGACVSTCPTGALDEAAFRARGSIDQTVTTTCAYCGVGCSLDVHVRDGAVVAIDPTLDGPANLGHTCVKGRFAHQYARSKERLTSPMLREKRTDPWRRASWEEAMGFVASRLSAIKAANGEDAIAFVSSSRCTNEENYVLMKLVRAALGTNNIDNCSRVCHSPTSMGMIQSLGESGGTNSFADIDETACLFVTGANPTEGHPVVGARMKEARMRGAKLVVADPRRIELAAMADVHLQLRPGTNVALYNGLAHVILRDGLVDEAYVQARVDASEAYRDFVRAYDPKRVESITGVPAALIEQAAHLYATTRPAAIFYGLGVTEQAQGVSGVRCLANLALLTGNIGRTGGGSNPLRGQNNVQGSSDVGALPTYLTMYRKMANDETRHEFEAKWGRPIKPERGLMIPEMFDAAIEGKLKAMYVFGEDIAQTDPNVQHVVDALETLELLVVHDIFENETARYAHVMLPGSSFLEKTGTFTNAERRIQMVREAVPPPGEARRDLDILLELSSRLGYPMPHTSAADVMDEIAELTPQWRGVSHARLGKAGLQWPVPSKDHPGTPVLYTEHFPTPSGRASLFAVDWEPPGEAASDRFPFILITGRQLAHYNSGTQTRRTANVELQAADLAEINPSDAARLGIAAGDVVEIESLRGSVKTWACITTRVAPGNVFLSFHFPEVKTNLLTSANADPLTSCPEYKVTAVDVRKVPNELPAPPVIAKGFRQDAFD